MTEMRRRTKCRCPNRQLGVLVCTAVVVILVYLGIQSSVSTNNEEHLAHTASVNTVQFDNREKLRDPFVNTTVNAPVNGAGLKHGFQWLSEHSAADAIVVDEKLSASLLEHLVFNESKRLEITCPQQVRMGRKEDGGWNVCVAGPYNIVKPCLVYSIGMGGEWSFDNMITSPKYECLDLAYDPTLGKPDHKPRPLLWFYNTGLGGADGVNAKKWSLKTFPTLLRENNHTDSTIDILKMDIEYSEWDALEVMLAKPSCLANVKQLMVEFHAREIDSKVHSSRKDLERYWRILRDISHSGFKLWNVWDNPACNFHSKTTPGMSYCACFNMYFLNIKYLV